MHPIFSCVTFTSFLICLQCLYDLLMNLLDEKGVSNDFVEKLSDFATAYENHLYINMLQNIQKFTSKK